MNTLHTAASPAMVAAFRTYGEAYSASLLGGDGSDEQGAALSNASDAAIMALMDMPCTTAGDFIVKVAAEMIDGGYSVCNQSTIVGAGVEPVRWHEIQWDGEFYIDPTHEQRHSAAMHRDLMATDVGRCIFALGHAEFDAEAWLEAAARAKVAVGVVVMDGEQPRPVMLSPTGDLTRFEQQRVNLLTALIKEPDFASARRAAILETIATDHPERVVRDTVVSA